MNNLLLKFDTVDLSNFSYPDIGFDKNKVERYLNLLEEPYKSEIEHVIRSTRVVQFDECVSAIERSIVKFLKSIGDTKFYIAYICHKIGSEHLFLYIFRYILHHPGFLGFIAETLHPCNNIPTFKDIDSTNTVHILNIDDCIYSGISQAVMIDEIVPNSIKWETRLDDCNVIWHTCVGFCSTIGYDWVSHSYNTSSKRWVLYCDEMISGLSLPMHDDIWKMKELYELDTYESTPIFFSHKISADIRTTFPNIYLDGYNPTTKEKTGEIVTFIPSRDPINALASHLLQD